MDHLINKRIFYLNFKQDLEIIIVVKLLLHVLSISLLGELMKIKITQNTPKHWPALGAFAARGMHDTCSLLLSAVPLFGTYRCLVTVPRCCRRRVIACCGTLIVRIRKTELCLLIQFYCWRFLSRKIILLLVWCNIYNKIYYIIN